MNRELPEVSTGQERKENQRSTCQHPLGHRKRKEFLKPSTSASLDWATLKPLTAWIIRNWKTPDEMGIPDTFRLWGKPEAALCCPPRRHWRFSPQQRRTCERPQARCRDHRVGRALSARPAPPGVRRSVARSDWLFGPSQAFFMFANPQSSPGYTISWRLACSHRLSALLIKGRVNFTW